MHEFLEHHDFLICERSRFSSRPRQSSLYEQRRGSSVRGGLVLLVSFFMDDCIWYSVGCSIHRCDSNSSSQDSGYSTSMNDNSNCNLDSKDSNCSRGSKGSRDSSGTLSNRDNCSDKC